MIVLTAVATDEPPRCAFDRCQAGGVFASDRAWRVKGAGSDVFHPGCHEAARRREHELRQRNPLVEVDTLGSHSEHRREATYGQPGTVTIHPGGSYHRIDPINCLGCALLARP